jgi:CHASE3 domain sensor protein
MQYTPDAIINLPYTDWMKNPINLAQDAQERAVKLIESHTVPPLDDDVQKELDRIEQAANKHILTE